MTSPRPEWADHLDHEVSQLLWLHGEMQQDDYRQRYADRVRRAMDVAYATHFRALLEFFHNGRERGRHQHAHDLHLSHAAPSAEAFTWTDYGRQRLQDADRLAGHLSQHRPGQTSDWDNPQDWALIRPMIERLLQSVESATEVLPRSVEEWHRIGERRPAV